MRRREFISGLGLTAIGPLAAGAQQVPVVGFLSSRSPDEAMGHTNAFRRGLEEMGFVEGRSVAVEYRWAKGDYNQLPSLAAELLSRPLALMVTTGDPAAKAAKAADLPIPLVFIVGQDPVSGGLVDSMNRPGKATGINFFTGDLGAKRLELLCSMVPSARIVGLLLNPRFGTEPAKQLQQAAQTLGREVVAQSATTDVEIEAAFSVLVKAGADGLVVQNDPFFDTRRSLIVALSSRHRLPGILRFCGAPSRTIFPSFDPLNSK